MVKVTTKKNIAENKNLLPSKTAHRSPSSTCVFEFGQRYHLLLQCLDLSKHFWGEGEVATCYYHFLYHFLMDIDGRFNILINQIIDRNVLKSQHL